MAVKGKRKSQTRGSQGRRRPAQAPRPPVTGHRRTPWYRTQGGLLVGGIVAVVLLGLGIYAIVDARSSAAQLSRRQSSLNHYTAEVRSLLQTIRPPVAEMLSVPADGRPVDDLFAKAEGWVKDLDAASTQAQGIPPASGQQEAQQIFARAVVLYTDAARTFSDAALAPTDAQKEIALRAAAQRDNATALWQIGVSLLDSARTAARLQPSLINSPADFAPRTPPAPQPTAPSDAGKQGKGGNGGKGGKGDKGGKGGEGKGGGNG
jgi:uncharacterized membrane protein YgcG